MREPGDPDQLNVRDRATCPLRLVEPKECTLIPRAYVLSDILGAARGHGKSDIIAVSVYSRAGGPFKVLSVPLRYRGGGQIDPRPNLQSDRRRQLGERGCNREARVRVDSELVVAAAMVLHECERGDVIRALRSVLALAMGRSRCSGGPWWASIRCCLILLDMVPGRWHQLVEAPGVSRRLVVTTSDGVTFGVWAKAG